SSLPAPGPPPACRTALARARRTRRMLCRELGTEPSASALLDVGQATTDPDDRRLLLTSEDLHQTSALAHVLHRERLAQDDEPVPWPQVLDLYCLEPHQTSPSTMGPYHLSRNSDRATRNEG